MNVSMPKGSYHGWGVAGTYLAEEIAKLPPLEGVTLHCISGHDFSPFSNADWNRINIGYCFFEHEILAYQYMPRAAKRWDYIVAGSKWCEYHLRIGGVERTTTVIQGVDHTIFSRRQPRAKDGRFIVFSGGKFEFRKGQDIVIAAMRRFMERHPDAWLACSWHNQWPNSIKSMEQSALITFNYQNVSPDVLYLDTLSRNGIDPARVILYPAMNNGDMSRIYADSDIGFFPNRCEGGNNMVMCEYMACGRTVVASHRTGQADVISSDNAFCLQEYTPRLVGMDSRETGVWFEPSVDEALDLLEQAYQQKQACDDKALRAADDMQRLSWQESARQFHAIATRISTGSEEIPPQLTSQCHRDEIEVLFSKGDLEGSERGFRDLLHQSPLDAELYNCLATVLDRQGRYQEAVAHYHKAISLNPQLAVVSYNLANSLQRAGDEDGALEILQQATTLKPEFLEAWKSLAMMYISREDFVKAAACFEKVVALEPGGIEGRCALGNMYSAAGRFHEAVDCFEAVLAKQPDHMQALESLGTNLHELEQLDRAEDCFRKVLERYPGKISALNNLGTVLRSMARMDEAIEIFDYAISITPNNGQVLFNRSMVRLAREELPQAWQDYEARFITKTPTSLYHSDLPRWEGEPLNGRGLLVQSEQGFGDTFQFVRYLPLLSTAGGSIVFECQNESVREALVGIDGVTIIARGEQMPPVSVQIPLASLPLLFGTNILNIPAAAGYLKAPLQRMVVWKERLAAVAGVFKVGLVWSGNKYNLNANRSMQFTDLEPLLKVDNTVFYSLQVGSDAQLPAVSSGRVVDLAARINDFGDTAAIIANLDLVITIDTAVAHLAGALGATTWVMLKYSPDWRWFLGRLDSPWYSSMRLFRQQSPGDWEGVVTAVAAELTIARDQK